MGDIAHPAGPAAAKAIIGIVGTPVTENERGRIEFNRIIPWGDAGTFRELAPTSPRLDDGGGNTVALGALIQGRERRVELVPDAHGHLDGAHPHRGVSRRKGQASKVAIGIFDPNERMLEPPCRGSPTRIVVCGVRQSGFEAADTKSIPWPRCRTGLSTCAIQTESLALE